MDCFIKLEKVIYINMNFRKLKIVAPISESIGISQHQIEVFERHDNTLSIKSLGYASST